MRMYDIALVLVRTTAILEFIHAGAGLVYTAIRFSFLIGSTEGSSWLNKVELATWMNPVEVAVIAMVMLAASKPIARFASKFATVSDAASHF
jgi:hypothetical protein